MSEDTDTEVIVRQTTNWEHQVACQEQALSTQGGVNLATQTTTQLSTMPMYANTDEMISCGHNNTPFDRPASPGTSAGYPTNVSNTQPSQPLK